MTTSINGPTSNLELTAKTRRVVTPLFGETTPYDELVKMSQQYNAQLTAIKEQHGENLAALQAEIYSFQEETQEKLVMLESQMASNRPSVFSRIIDWCSEKWSSIKDRVTELWQRPQTTNNLTPEQITAIAQQVTQQLQQNQLSIDIKPQQGDFVAIDNINEFIQNFKPDHLPYLEDEITSDKKLRDQRDDVIPA